VFRASAPVPEYEIGIKELPMPDLDQIKQAEQGGAILTQ